MSINKNDLAASEALVSGEPHEWYGPCDRMGPYGECSVCTNRTRVFQLFFQFLGWRYLSFGVHVGLDGPHIDLHVPYGFVRLGWWRWEVASHHKHYRSYGWVNDGGRNDGTGF